MLLLNATDDTTRPIHLPPPPMTDPRLIALSSNPGQVEPGPFSEHDLREQWNAQADEFNQWESLDSAEQLAWAQTRAIAAAATASPELPKPEAERVLRLAEIINKVGLDYDSKDIVFSAAALAEAILAHPGFSGCHDGPVGVQSALADLLSQVKSCDGTAQIDTEKAEQVLADWNQRSAWQPIETAPRGGTKVLAWDGSEMQIGWTITIHHEPGVRLKPGAQNPHTFWVYTDEELHYYDFEPTHWQPLPSPPITPNPHD
jgi:hypothetical protein